MATGDRDFLRAYARGGAAEQPPRQDDESVEDYAKRVGADPGPPQDEPKDESPDEPKDEPEKPAPKGKKGSGLGGTAARGVARHTEVVRDWIAARPTPGGIGVLLLILLLFVAVIVPVAGGYTRLQLLWLTLLGRTELPDASGNVPQTGIGATSSSTGSSTSATGGVSASAVALAAPALPATSFPMPMPGGARVKLPPTLPTAR